MVTFSFIVIFHINKKKENSLSWSHPIGSISKKQKIMGLEGNQMFALYDNVVDLDCFLLSIFF